MRAILSITLLLTWTGTAPFYNVYQQDVALPQKSIGERERNFPIVTTGQLTNTWRKIATVSSPRLVIPKDNTANLEHAFRVKACNYADEP